MKMRIMSSCGECFSPLRDRSQRPPPAHAARPRRSDMDSQGVAEFVAGLTWEQIPATAQHRAKLAFRDTLGTMLGGGSTTAGRVAATVAAREGSRGDALIVSTGERAGRPMAAYANGVAASALD